VTEDAAWTRLVAARVGRLATTAPRIVPVTFAVLGRAIVHAVDHKPKTTRALARIEDLRRDPRASLLADHYDEDWSQLWWVRADGTARVLAAAEAPEAIDALARKYPQYADRRPDGPVVMLDVQRISGWEARQRDEDARWGEALQ
jgi:PPOX class probable F420-dependent enzyme